MKKNMIKNFILGSIIIILSFFTQVIIIKAVLIIIGILNIAMGIIIYSLSSYSRDTKLYSKIYDDRLEHCQRISYTKKYLHSIIYYDEVKRSEQNPKGSLVLYLKKTDKSKQWTEDKNGRLDYDIKDGMVILHFADIKAKLTLINEFYEKIGYPKKNYKILDDEADDYYSEEDLKWDKFGKHGL